MEFDLAPIGDGHDLDEFDCGKPVLDGWLLDQARRASAAGVAQVYVGTRQGSPRVCAYYAICPTEVIREVDGFSRSTAGGYSRVPGYLIARLALDRTLWGNGFGEQLLMSALETVVRAAAIGGGRLVVVDALDEDAAKFYERFGFVRAGARKNRLLMKISTAAAAIELR